MNRLSHPSPCRQPRRRQDGFTLVELMISVAVSFALLLAMISFLVNASQTNRELAKANSQVESGRFAIQALQNDILQAGYWGNFMPQFDDLTLSSVPTDVPAAVPDPCLAYDAANWTSAYKTNLVGIPLQVYDAVPGSCGSVVTSRKANTDVLVVRHAHTCVPGETNCEASVSGKLYFQASGCESEISAGQRWVLDTTGFTLKQRGCTGTPPTTTGALAPVRKFVSNLYYIRDYANSAGDGIPTLVRSEFDLASGTLAHQTAQPLVEGIEGFKLELGIDNVSDAGLPVDFTQAINWSDTTTKTSPTNRGDGAPDGSFIRCTGTCTAAQLMNTVAVKLHLLVRSSEATHGYTDTKTYTLAGTTFGPYNDGFKRHVFTTTVRLMNVAGRRETP
ncbi:MAG TPA: PilW family protein [Noviherbaspirillum sp.]|uniref:PilW family protein n=1 Tax=Noviherbaspirillum sp. TaxID=1926288 RepID=UPI002D41C47D|nr:PilW family protein [Noviherbaspirillum sp.]HYD96813.1 PilW family protein [Noviherbaspirillum sp.]